MTKQATVHDRDSTVRRHHVRDCGLVSGDACVACIMFPPTGSFPDGMYGESNKMVEILVVPAQSSLPATTLATGAC